MIENAYHGSVGGLATNTYGRVDQLEDRYLGMVEAPSSNLGTSTRDEFIQFSWPFGYKKVLLKTTFSDRHFYSQ